MNKIFKRKPKLLNEQEKRFVESIVKQFMFHKHITITKREICYYVEGHMKECAGSATILFEFDDSIMVTAWFMKESMFKNMVSDKKYTPKELGIM